MKLKRGDVFTINLSESEVGFGQILELPTKSTIIISVFNFKSSISDKYDISNIVRSEVLLLGYSLDAKLYHKHWSIIGNIEPSQSIMLPYNKVGTPPDDMFITDYKGKKLRKCTLAEFDSLNYQTVIAPIRYENALKAFFKLSYWNKEDYDKLLYEHCIISNEVYNTSRQSI